jgi:hypothetical protein
VCCTQRLRPALFVCIVGFYLAIRDFQPTSIAGDELWVGSVRLMGPPQLKMADSGWARISLEKNKQVSKRTLREGAKVMEEPPADTVIQGSEGDRDGCF